MINAASLQGGPVSPGEIIAVFGAGIGPAGLAGLQLDANGRVATVLAETRALFDGVPAPLIYASATQTNVVVPYEVAGKQTTQLVMEYKGQRIAAVNLQVGTSAPGLFTANISGKGFAAAVNDDGTLNSSSNPAAKGLRSSSTLRAKGKSRLPL